MFHPSWGAIETVLAIVAFVVTAAALWEARLGPAASILGATVSLIAAVFVARETRRMFVGLPATPDEVKTRNRRDMLKRVRNDWVLRAPDQSLYKAVLIELGLQERTDLVPSPWGVELRTGDQPGRLLPRSTTIASVFDEGKSPLLILGEPGSGKTTMLLDLARYTIDQAEEDATQPIPVVFNLSSWSKKSLADWLVAELESKYTIPRKVGKPWVDNDELLLLLDGLDEVGADQREACLAAINEFRKDNLVPIVVCSRLQEYEGMRGRLAAGRAVCLQALTDGQVNDFLHQVGPELDGVRDLMRKDPIVAELARTPLWLSIITLAYWGKSAAELTADESRTSRQRHLLDTYVAQMLRRRSSKNARRFRAEQTIHWLSRLARYMLTERQSPFLIEWMQSSFLPSQRLRPIVTWGIALGPALTCGLASGLVIGLILGVVRGLGNGVEIGLLGGLFSGLCGWLGSSLAEGQKIGFVEAVRSDLAKARSGLVRGMGIGAIGGALLGLGSGVETGLLGGLAIGLVGGAALWVGAGKRIAPIERFGWDSARARRLAAGGVVMGVALGMASWLAYFRAFGLLGALLLALVCGPTFGLGAGAFGGLVPGKIATRAFPNEGMHRSARMALIVPLAVGLVMLLIGGLVGWAFEMVHTLDVGRTSGLDFGLTLGLVLGVLFWAGTLPAFGGYAVLQHAALRVVLWRVDCIPLNYAAFLDHAAERVLLRKVGGGYIFVDRMQMEYFATLGDGEGK